MGFAQILSRAQFGMTAPLVRVEVHIGNGLPTFNIVGLAAPVVREAKERVRAALANCGFEFPAGRITVNLAPADLPKEGGRFDLPIALGILVASGQMDPPADCERSEFYGELALTGELKPVPGLLRAAQQAAESGHDLHVPSMQVLELRLVEGVRLQGVSHLGKWVAGEEEPIADETSAYLVLPPLPDTAPDIREIRGQHQARRALVIAAAGGHSLLMCGPPGSGKSMLARCLPGLLPALSRAEILEVASIAAVAQFPISRGRPFRAPHHTASAHAIVGGGPLLSPGEASLAHRGVLFLDELPEFDRRVLEALREPLETGHIVIARTRLRAEFPAAFQLVAAMNPCPCGRAGLTVPPCRCRPEQITRYRARVSGPLLDRIDLQLTLPQVDPRDLASEPAAAPGEPADSKQASERVRIARERQLTRQGCLNAQLGPEATLERCRADPEGMRLLREASQKRGCSARGQHRILRVARTMADLAGVEIPAVPQIAEALAMRWEE